MAKSPKAKEKVLPVAETIPDIIELPHEAILNTETGEINFKVDRISISVSIDEFMMLCDQMEDIASIVAQMASKEEDECPTCGTKFHVTTVSLPHETDFN